MGADWVGALICTVSMRLSLFWGASPIAIVSASDTSNIYAKFNTKSNKHLPDILKRAEKLSGKSAISDVPSASSIISPL